MDALRPLIVRLRDTSAPITSISVSTFVTDFLRMSSQDGEVFHFAEISFPSPFFLLALLLCLLSRSIFPAHYTGSGWYTRVIETASCNIN